MSTLQKTKKKIEIVKSYCSSCGQETNQDVLSTHTESYRDDYACNIHYQIVQCRGCEKKSFRKVFVDLESAFPLRDGEWEVPEEIDYYPKFIKNHREIDNDRHISKIVRKIYNEVLLALQEEAFILAGLGLRGIIEAVCNDLEISGRNLAVRINKLVTAGYISKKDAERLHGIRFMGNDAAHEIKTPKKNSISIALQIIEHLLSSVYILENEANGKIEAAISEYRLFEELLDEKITEYNSGDEIPLAKFLGKELRRVSESISSLEEELVSRISNGEYTKLSVGKVDNYQGSRQQLQHFIVK